MPISLSVKPMPRAKTIWLSLLLFFSPLFFYGQTLTGLWVGALHNDSTSVRKDQSFEIALTEYRGKVFGYSRSEFIVNDTLYYIVKRVKGTIEGDVCEVTDDEIISYNFRGKLDKGIKVTSTFRRNQTDSTWQLDGNWKTNKTKNYYSITGKVKLAEEKDLTASKLFPHLEELNKADEMVFYKERKEPAPMVKVAKPERIQTSYTDKAEKLQETKDAIVQVHKPSLPEPIKPATVIDEPLAKNSAAEKAVIPVTVIDQPTSSKPVAEKLAVIEEPKAPTVIENKKPDLLPKEQPVVTNKPEINNPVVAEVKKQSLPEESKPSETVAAPIAIAGKTEPVKTNPAAQENSMVKTTTTPVKPVQKTVAITKPAEQKPAPVAQNNTIKPVVPSAIAKTEEPKTVPPVQAQKNVPVTPAINTPVVAEIPRKKIDPSALLIKQSSEDPIKKSTMISGRKSEFSQEVYFKSDSLILTLYDNGEIDGDTVSVYINGEVVMPSQGLKSSAIRKTIHMDDGTQTFTLVMFAESLGKYPPNTGLLVIRDGDDVYNLRFSSDFQKSSGIVFRRKTN
jgi:hypothetical protein